MVLEVQSLDLVFANSSARTTSRFRLIYQLCSASFRLMPALRRHHFAQRKTCKRLCSWSAKTTIIVQQQRVTCSIDASTCRMLRFQQLSGCSSYRVRRENVSLNGASHHKRATYTAEYVVGLPSDRRLAVVSTYAVAALL